MHKNQVWIAFLAVIALIVFWFSSLTLYKVYTYYSLSGQIPATQTEWKLEKLAEDRYALAAHYSYTVRGKDYKGETILRNRIFRNPFPAEEAIKKLKGKKWVIWYTPKMPAHSAIRKAFPLKELAYTGVMWVILIYFIWLGTYISKRKKQ